MRIHFLTILPFTGSLDMSTAPLKSAKNIIVQLQIALVVLLRKD